MTDFDLNSFLPYQLAVIAEQVSTDFAKLYGEKFGISVPEWRVLAHLNQSGNISVREIHSTVHMEKSKVSRAAQRLENRGLISKKTNPTDRRLLELALTDEGRDLVARILPEARRFEQALEARLGPDRVAQLRQTIADYLEETDARHAL